MMSDGSWYYSTIVHEQRHTQSKQDVLRLLKPWAHETLAPLLTQAAQKSGLKKPKRIDYWLSYDDRYEGPVLDAALVDVPTDNHRSTVMRFHLEKYFSTRILEGGGLNIVQGHDDPEDIIVDLRPDETPDFVLVPVCDDPDPTTGLRPTSDHPCWAARVLPLFPDYGLPGALFGPKDERLIQKLQQLLVEKDGLSRSAAKDTFFRMLYLSAVTVTTVGYGDIVPLTDLARTAVAAEAIVGIVLIGLFLNALSHERGQ